MMYSSDLKHGLKLNPFKDIDHNIMLKTIQNLYYKKTNGVNMTSPFLVDNILHQQKTVNFHNQYLNHQIESYVLQQRQNCQNFERSRENSPDLDDSKMADGEDDRQDAVTEAKLEQDDDSKSREDDESFNNVKSEAYYNDYYRENAEKEILSIPNLNRRCAGCGAFDCPPFSCKKSGIRRLEELEKRFNFNYQENSGDEGEIGKEKGFTDDIVRSCEEFSEQKKPLLKFSVSAILGDREDGARNSNINEARIEDRIQRLYGTNSVSIQVAPPLLDIESKNQLSKYSKQDKRFSKNAEGISLIFTKEQNKEKSYRVLNAHSRTKNIKYGKGIRWLSSDNLIKDKATSKLAIETKDKHSSTPYLPLAAVCEINVNKMRTPPENIIITSQTGINEDLIQCTEQKHESNRKPVIEPSIIKLKASLEENNDEIVSLGSEGTYNNFLGVIYSPKVVSVNNIFDKATTSKVISKIELNARSEHEVLTINAVDDKTISTNSKVNINAVEKDNLRTNSEVSSIPEDIKKSVSFKLDTRGREEKNYEKDASETEIGIADISDSTSKINDANELNEVVKTIAKISKTPDLISSTSKVSFKPESVTIYIDEIASDQDIMQSEIAEFKGTTNHDNNIVTTSQNDVSTDVENTPNNVNFENIPQNIIKNDTKTQMNVVCEPIHNYKNDSSYFKCLINDDNNSNSNYTEETHKETVKQGPSLLNFIKDAIPNPSFTNSEDNHEDNTKKSVSILKFTDRDSDDDSNCNVSKHMSPERVRRSASRVTFVDEVVSISTGNIFRINSKTNSYGKTSPKSDSFERDSRGSYLDEMAFFKNKLDQKLTNLMKQEASTSRRDDHLYYTNQVVLRQLYLGGDGRLFEGIASDSNINDSSRRGQGPVHETVSLDRSIFSSTKSAHEDVRKDVKKSKDDTSKDSKNNDK